MEAKNNFKAIAKQMGIHILEITENEAILAKGIHIPEALLAFKDGDTSIRGYPDTGVCILFKGSNSSSTEEKYKPYIDTDHKTIREIVFQSRNAAAQFVLGSKGRTNHWKCVGLCE